MMFRPINLSFRLTCLGDLNFSDFDYFNIPKVNYSRLLSVHKGVQSSDNMLLESFVFAGRILPTTPRYDFV